MSGPLFLSAIGVDAKNMASSFDRSGRWQWTHPLLGIVIEVHADDIREHWIVTMQWRGVRAEAPEGTMSDLADAWDVAMSHAQSYVPRLWSELRALEGAEEMRQARLRSQHEDEQAEAEDERENQA